MKSKLNGRFLRVVLLLLVALLLSLAAATYYHAGPALACLIPAKNRVRVGISSRALVSGGLRRCYLVYVPAAYNAARPSPVVLALHGFAGNAEGLRSIAVWEPIAEREGFVVVYPDGSSFPLRWNIGPAANIPEVDDVQFIRDTIANLSTIVSIDKARIYVSGFSNGGQMAHRIACRMADEIAAIGIVDGIDGGMLEECMPSRAVPVMGFFGTANPLAGVSYPIWFQHLVNVRLEEGPPLPANVIDLWVQQWAKRNGCHMTALPLPPTTNATGIRYGGCQNDADVVLYRIEGQGHAWPGGPALPTLGDSVSDINASEVMWAFFQQHPLVQNR
jgi:polyhydroxybutyrate depolymerase